MTDEEWKAWEIQRAGQMNPAPKPSTETRLDRLEDDASALRTAILKLDQDNRWHRVVFGILVVYVATLPLVWMLNFPPPSVMP